MTQKNFRTNRGDPSHRKGAIVRNVAISLFLFFLVVAALPFPGYAAAPTYPIFSADVKTTRERTVSPASITDPNAPDYLTLDRVDQYEARGYSSWGWGDPVDYGPLLLDGTSVAKPAPVETLLRFFSMSDIHIVDKESPAQAIYGALIPPSGFGKTNTSAYSPIILSTTHVLDAAVQTINALNSQAPFDFGMSLGDDANNNQYNELRWFIDVMDGKWITPSTGAHRGAGFIDYQIPYQSAGLDKSIPWYQTIGNHDQYWCGSLLVNDYDRRILVGNTVIDMGIVGPTQFPSLDDRGYYMGVIDGTTPYGTILGAGPAGTMAALRIAADPNRRALATANSTTLNWMKEFFNTTSKPKGHGFKQANIDNDFASYTFEPKASLPLKVIVLDDTCKENPYPMASSYARACLDQTRYDWLVNELDQGQAEGKLMIITAHIPVGPNLNVPAAPLVAPANIPNDTPIPLFFSDCQPDFPDCQEGDPLEHFAPITPYNVVSDAMLLATLHNYPNLLLWMSGHRHINVVTPQPAPAGKGPEYGFWEVETSSLRDFPQEFRTFEIQRNNDNTVSILVTDVDPAVQDDPAAPHDTLSPAAKSRGYAVGANRIAGGVPALTDRTSRTYNAELIKTLPAPYTLTVEIPKASTGSGSVISTPYSGIDCPAGSCSATYLPGTEVTLVATPDAGSAIAGWATSAGNSFSTITMNNDVTVTANFTRDPTLVVTPAFKNFGNLKVGKRAVATFMVKNTRKKGVADLVIGSLTKTETANPAQFTLVSGMDACSGKTLKPGKSCTFKVSFKPTSVFTKLATVSIPSNDPDTPEIIQLTGVGK